jgi:hypothetical protein
MGYRTSQKLEKYQIRRKMIQNQTNICSIIMKKLTLCFIKIWIQIGVAKVLDPTEHSSCDQIPNPA